MTQPGVLEWLVELEKDEQDGGLVFTKGRRLGSTAGDLVKVSFQYMYLN